MAKKYPPNWTTIYQNLQANELVSDGCQRWIASEETYSAKARLRALNLSSSPSFTFVKFRTLSCPFYILLHPLSILAALMIMLRSQTKDQQSFYQTVVDIREWKRDKVKHKYWTESIERRNNKKRQMCAATNNTQYNFNNNNQQNNAENNARSSNTHLDKDKYEKLKRFILIGVLAVLGIVGWHIYGEC